MWAEYRKTFIWVQLFIAAFLLSGRYAGKMPWPAVGVMFVVLEVGSVIGAWWGTHLKRKMNSQRDRLPLEK